MTTSKKPANIGIPGYHAPRPELRVGSPVCQCQICGDFFSTPFAFDKHLRGVEATRCLTHKERIKAGMFQTEHGVWSGAAYRGKA